MTPLFATLSSTTAVIIIFVYLFGLSLKRLQHFSRLTRQIITGVMFGLFGMLSIMWAVPVTPGVLVDIRGPFIVLAGAFGGLPGAGIAAAMIATYRVVGIGGVGTLGGAASIIANLGLGIHWYDKNEAPSPLVWVLLGWASMLISIIAASLLLPATARALFLQGFIPTASLLYPLATLAIATLLQREYSRLALMEALQHSEAQLRQVFDQTFQFMGLLTTDGTLLQANQTALRVGNLSSEDVIGKPFWMASWWSHSPDVQQRLKQAITDASQGQLVRYREQVHSTNNDLITIDFSIKPIRDHDGQIVMLVPEGRDITDSITAEQQRIALKLEQERTRMYQAFIADTSHHLRSPITALKTSLYYIQKKFDYAQDDQANYIQHVTDALQRMPRVIKATTDLENVLEDLLEISRLDDPDDLTVEPVNLNTLLYSLVSDLNTEHVTFSLKTSPTPPIIAIDRSDLSTLLTNLLENALKYTPPGGHITLSTILEDNTARIIIQDTGIGIPPESLPNIFTRFYRGDDARLHTSTGTGLGLSIVKKIATIHAGTIDVTSTVGHGTCVTVSFPAQFAKMPA